MKNKISVIGFSCLISMAVCAMEQDVPAAAVVIRNATRPESLVDIAADKIIQQLYHMYRGNREHIEAAIRDSQFAGIVPAAQLRPYLAKHWYLRYGNNRNFILPELNYGFSLDELRIYGKLPDVHQGLLPRIVKLGRCLNLRSLRINDLRGLSRISNINTVQGLSLNDNLISAIPANAFIGLSCLEFLDLTMNRMSTIHANAFIGLDNLEHLYIRNNPLSTLQTGAFDGLKGLRFLYIGNNQLSTIQPDVFCGLNNLVELDLADNLITIVPSGMFTGLGRLELLDLGHNKISAMQPAAFAGLSNLKSLLLRNNQLAEIQADVFEGLSNLRRLVLDNNELSTIQSGTFAELGSLDYLHLRHNKISSMQPSAFSGLGELRGLLLDNNQLSIIQPGTFIGLRNLFTLQLENNQLPIIQLENAFAGLNLVEFFIDNNVGRTRPVVLTNIPQRLSPYCTATFNNSSISATQGIGLMRLCVAQRTVGHETMNCQLPAACVAGNSMQNSTVAPTMHAACQQLDISDADRSVLAHNLVQHFHVKHDGDLEKIAEEIRSNRLVPDSYRPLLAKYWYLLFGSDKKFVAPELDYEFSVAELKHYGKLPVVMDNKLDLSNLRINDLTGLQSICAIDRVQGLDLSNNRMTRLRAHCFSGFKSLLKLNLDHNRMSSIEDNIFDDLKVLKFLYLRGNQIKELDHNAFKGLHNLIRLYLDANQISELPKYTFSDLKMLKDICLGDNRITSVSNNVFNCPNLVTVSLRNNPIRSVARDAFDSATNLRLLNLCGNHLDVDTRESLESHVNRLISKVKLFLN